MREIAEHAVAQRVMGDQPLALDARAGRTDDVEDRQPLRPRPHDAVQCAQLADAIRGRQQRGSLDPRVAVRGVGRVQLVGAHDPLDARAGVEGIVERKRIVARHAERAVDSKIRQAIDHVFRYGGHEYSSGGSARAMRHRSATCMPLGADAKVDGSKAGAIRRTTYPHSGNW